jgi:hypothetical protein
VARLDLAGDLFEDDGRERLMATGTANSAAASRYAAMSRIQDRLSKSAARNQQVSSASMA